MGFADFCQIGGAIFFVDFVVFGAQLFDHLCHTHIPFALILSRPGNNQRRAGFINQHVVNFVDNGVIMTTLHTIFQVHTHIVTQVIKPELTVCTVGNIGRVSLLAGHHTQLVLVLVRRLFLGVDQKRFFAVFGARRHLQHAHAQPQHIVDRSHPTCITPRQIIVNGDQVHPLTGQRIQVDGQRGNQRFTFASAHLGNFSPVQCNTADHLHIIMPLPDGTLAGLAYNGKCLDQQIVQCFILRQPGAEFNRFGRQPLIGQFFIRCFQGIDFVNQVGKFIDLAFVGVAPNETNKFF